jgi:hypothetical protein
VINTLFLCVCEGNINRRCMGVKTKMDKNSSFSFSLLTYLLTYLLIYLYLYIYILYMLPKCYQLQSLYIKLSVFVTKVLPTFKVKTW